MTLIVQASKIIHFICPKPDDLPSLMSGLIDSHKRMKAGNVSPIIHAAAIAYGFVRAGNAKRVLFQFYLKKPEAVLPRSSYHNNWK